MNNMNSTDNLNNNLNPSPADISKKEATPCGVIRDLMILYEDDVCSEESRELVQEHIKDCDGCRKAYEQASGPFPPVTASPEEENKEDARFIKTLRKYRKKVTLLNTLIVSFFLLVTGALIKIFWTEFLDSGFFSVPAEDIRITELYQLAGGDIYCTLKVPKLINPPTLGALEISDRTSKKHEGYYELHFQYPLSVDEEKYLYCDTISLIFPASVSGGFYSYPESDSTYSCTSIYYEGKNKKDRLTIWEEGQKLEKAPEQIEKKAILTYQADGNISKALDEMEQIGKTFSKDDIVQSFLDYYHTQNEFCHYPIWVCEE